MAPIRKIASTKLYHIVVRGVNKQNIFYDKQDVKNIKEKYKEQKKSININC